MMEQCPAITVSIAIIDDDEAILDAVQFVLEIEGWQVWTFATGETFLADFRRHEPDCIILDPHLPTMNGAEVARSVYAVNRHIPIICLTAYPTSPVTAEVMQAGARVMLTKPATFEELYEQVQTAIG